MATIETLSGTDQLSASRIDINANFAALNSQLNTHASQHLPGGSDALATGAPNASAVGDAGAEGSDEGFARTDHIHEREAFDSPAPSAVGDSSDDGASTDLARADHVHAREAFGTAQDLADATADGSADDVARADHEHKREVEITKNGLSVGVRRILDLIEGTGITITTNDDAGGDRVRITINSVPTEAGGLTSEGFYGMAHDTQAIT